MPAVVMPSTVRLALNGTCFGQQVVNVLHYRYTSSAPNTSTLSAFCAAWLSAHSGQWANCHSNEYSLRELVATDIGVVGGAQATFPLSPPTVGAVVAEAFPNNVAIAISWRTANTGRKNRGRSFIGGLPVNFINNDTVSGSALSVLSALATALIAQTFTGGYDLAVGSRVDQAARIVTGFVLEALADSMRTRLSGRGN